MRGVVLAGGSGSRLRPLTDTTNKHLLPVYDHPMVCHALTLLARMGVQDVALVVGGLDPDRFIRVAGDGRDFGLRTLFYTYQTEARGVADALRCAAAFCAGDSVCLLLADNVFEFVPLTRGFDGAGHRARIFLAQVDHPEQYGIAVFDGDRLTRIDEKPRDPYSHWAVTGCYLYDAGVFEMIESLTPSRRGELEITDINNAYLRAGALEVEKTTGFWVDCGESLQAFLRASVLVSIHGCGHPRPTEPAVTSASVTAIGK